MKLDGGYSLDGKRILEILSSKIFIMTKIQLSDVHLLLTRWAEYETQIIMLFDILISFPEYSDGAT